MLTLLDENDMGDAGMRMYDSVLKLELLRRFGPPESPELASVTNELTPALGPGLATLFKNVLLASPETGLLCERPTPWIEFDEFPKDELGREYPTACDCPSPWKEMPELEEEFASPLAVRVGPMDGKAPGSPIIQVAIQIQRPKLYYKTNRIKQLKPLPSK